MIIDGKEIAEKILLDLKKRAKHLSSQNIIPHLVVVLTSNDPSSVSYVNQKKIKGKSVGAKITVKRISQNIPQSQLLKTIKQFNNNNNIHGIIVQRPLPKTIDTHAVSLAIDLNKDIDGFLKDSKFNPPIAMAILRILEEIFARLRLDKGATFIKWLASQKIVIIGKGETGGAPILTMLKKMEVEPTIIDSKTIHPELLTKKADIIISCVGKPNIIRPEMIKKGVVLIGVGLHKGQDGKLHGDYDDERIKDIASFYTPTPGGVGPVNVACLLENLVKAAAC